LGLEEVEGEAEEEEDGIDAVDGELTEEMIGLTVSTTGDTGAAGLETSFVEEIGLGETGDEAGVEEETVETLEETGSLFEAETDNGTVDTT
jgi:hypothetical protein